MTSIGFVGLGHAWFDMHKDVRLALSMARELQIPLPSAEGADEMLSRAEERGYGRRDIAALFAALEQLAVARAG
jgi:3-hydroxyisobutyrate dehydrogenase-like beta-hydroxyacid dehydrogenase